MNEYQIIGTKLKELRGLKGIDQIDIATILNIKQPYYSQLENGKKKIKIEQLLKIANEYDIELDWFLGRDTEANKKIRETNNEKSINSITAVHSNSRSSSNF